MEGVLRKGTESRKRMIKLGTPDLCSNNLCDLKGLTVWCNQEIVFEVDHIDCNREYLAELNKQRAQKIEKQGTLYIHQFLKL